MASLVPESIQDDSTLALEALIERLDDLNLSPVLVNIIDLVTSSALPHLAEQFHVTGDEGWLLAVSDTERRALIKAAIAAHRYKGTPYAIKSVLEALGFQGELEEWFQYAGQPYHFRIAVFTSNGREIIVSDVARLQAMVNEYKNVRSRCESISLTAVQPAAGVYIAHVSMIGITVTTQPHL